MTEAAQTAKLVRTQGVTAPAGFRAAGIAAGIKASGAADLALVFNEGPDYAAAGRDYGPANMPFESVANNGQGSTFFTFLVFETMLFAIGIAFATLAMVKERAELQFRSAALSDPLTGVGIDRFDEDDVEVDAHGMFRGAVEQAILANLG